MTDPSIGFPMNVVAELDSTFKGHVAALLDEDFVIITRPLRNTDPSRSVGIFPVDWRPSENSFEMTGGVGPTLSRYLFRVQNLVKHTDEIEGRALYAHDSKLVRAVLYRDTALRVRLAALTETTLGMRERTQRYGVNTQRFLNNEINGMFLYLSTTEFWLETETVPEP